MLVAEAEERELLWWDQASSGPAEEQQLWALGVVWLVEVQHLPVSEFDGPIRRIARHGSQDQGKPISTIRHTTSIRKSTHARKAGAKRAREVRPSARTANVI